MGYERIIFWFWESPTTGWHACKVNKLFHCLIICIYFFLFSQRLLNSSLNDSFFQTPPLLDAKLRWLVWWSSLLWLVTTVCCGWQRALYEADTLEQRRPCTHTSATMSNFYSHTLKKWSQMRPFWSQSRALLGCSGCFLGCFYAVSGVFWLFVKALVRWLFVRAFLCSYWGVLVVC